MSSVDDPDNKPLNQTRTGTATGHANERQMLNSRQDTFGIRTIIRDNVDGTTTLCKTRAGMPEFDTNELDPEEDPELYLRSFIITSENGKSHLLKFDDTTRTVSLWKPRNPPDTYYVEEKFPPIRDPEVKPKKQYADVAYLRDEYARISGRKLFKLGSGTARFALFSPSAYQHKYVYGVLYDGRLDYRTSGRARSGYKLPVSVPYTVALSDPPSINYGDDSKLSLVWGNDAYGGFGSVIYTVSPESVALVSETKLDAPSLMPLSLTGTPISGDYNPNVPWNLPQIEPRTFYYSVSVPSNPAGCFYGTYQMIAGPIPSYAYPYESGHVGSRSGYTVSGSWSASASYGVGTLTKAISVNSANEYAHGTKQLMIDTMDPASRSFAETTAAAGDSWSWQPSASYPAGYMDTVNPWDAGNETKYVLQANSRLTIGDTSQPGALYDCVYTLNNLKRSGQYLNMEISSTGHSSTEYDGAYGCNGEVGYYTKRWAMVGPTWWQNAATRDFDEYTPNGPNIDATWKNTMFHDPDNGVKVELIGEITVRCTNHAINRLLLTSNGYEPPNVEFLSASIIMDLVITTPGGSITKNLLNTGTTGDKWGFNAVQVNFIPNPDATPGNQIYVPVFAPTHDTFGPFVPPKEQGQVSWIAYETATEFAARTQEDKRFRFLMCHQGALPIPFVVVAMFLPLGSLRPTIMHPFYNFVRHITPEGVDEEPDVKIQILYNQEVDWVAPLFDGNPHATLTRI